MIRAVIFDFGQTLADSADGFRKAEKDAKEAIYHHLFPTGPDAAWESFLPAYRKLRKAFHDRSDFSRAALWNAVYEHFSATSDPGRIERWETDYWAKVKAMTTPFPETRRVLETLSRDYRLALITNTQGQKVPGGHRIALFPDLETCFDTIIVAGESGIPPKPDPEAFRTCLDKMDLAPRQAVFVGDDWRIDICGAADAGLHPVWIQHHTVSRNWPTVETQVPVITDLNQLAARISGIGQ